MTARTRREFLSEVGRGVLVAGLGSGLAADMGLASASFAAERSALSFGPLEPLVGLMQETPPAKLLPVITDQIQRGTELKRLVAAAALANARTFGGEDYVGFHTLMALAPALEMARQMPRDRRPLPVMKVLYRNTSRIQEKGGRSEEVLHPVKSAAQAVPAEGLRDMVRRRDVAAAEAALAASAQRSPEDAYHDLLVTVEDATEVHRVVLPYRAWVLLDVVGREHALTMLRQSVRYCVKAESPNQVKYFGGVRELLPKLFDRYRLQEKSAGTRTMDDAWVLSMSETLFRATPEQAADAVANALAEGIAPDTLGEAISLAANQLVLRDAGRPPNQTSPGKPVGSVHGDSIGVHACDSANAWRNMARVSNWRNQAACLILAGYQAALDRVNRGGDFLNWQPYPLAEQARALHESDPAALLRLADEAIRINDQARASAAIHRYGGLGHDPKPAFDLMLRYAVSEDGALHAEKYYQTVSDEFQSTRPAFRWRQLVALARVTASEFGKPAAGYEEACKLLKV